MSGTGSSQIWASLARHGKVDLSHLGVVVREYRKARGMSQRDLAQALNRDQSSISRLEIGTRPIRDVGLLVQVSRLLEIPPSSLGLSNELVMSIGDQDRERSPGTTMKEPLTGLADAVAASQDEWRTVRRHLNHHRHALARRAVELYPANIRLGETTLLAPPTWMPTAPVRLEEITLTWAPTPAKVLFNGNEPETAAVRPLRAPGHQYDRYTSAVRYLDPPTLFENRPSYRLEELEWHGDGGSMVFGLATYFDKLDVSEALGHELAAVSLHRPISNVTWKDLPFRSLINDPFNPQRRAILPAVTTLTLRRRPMHGTASFLLLWRDPGKVATAAGVYDVIPAGEFQPSSVAPWDQAADFDLWRNIVREFSEELLGTPEHDGSRSEPIDYAAWPLYRTFEQARADGKLSAYCLGAGVDALTLAATILTAVIIDDDVFDDVLNHVVRVNSEGVVVLDEAGEGNRSGIPFTESAVSRLLTAEPMASPGAACLARAWRHRVALLTP